MSWFDQFATEGSTHEDDGRPPDAEEVFVPPPRYGDQGEPIASTSSPPVVRNDIGPTGGGTTGPIPWAQVYEGLPPGPASLPEVVKRLQALGYDARIDTRGRSGTRGLSDDKLVVNGTGYDTIKGVDGDSPEWLTNPLSYSLDGGGSKAGAGAGGGDGLNLPYAVGASFAPWKEDFRARTPEQIRDDPAYQFQLAEGTRAITNNAAARGTLRTGGTLKGLTRFGQGLADTYDQKFYNRDMGEYGLRRENFMLNQDRPWGKFIDFANLGSAGFTTGSGSQYASSASDLMTGAANARGAAGVAGANAYNNFFAGLGDLAVYGGGVYDNRPRA